MSVSALVLLLAGGTVKDRSRRRELLSGAFGTRRARGQPSHARAQLVGSAVAIAAAHFSR